MCADHGDGSEDDRPPAVPIPEEDLQRVRVLRRIAVEALTEVNRILAGNAGVDVRTSTSVTIPLATTADAVAYGDGLVPPVYESPCHTFYGSDGACTYEWCDPPGVTRLCLPITLSQ